MASRNAAGGERRLMAIIQTAIAKRMTLKTTESGAAIGESCVMAMDPAARSKGSGPMSMEKSL
jgi:hypothetical protein